jgi:hypothetical protein
MSMKKKFKLSAPPNSLAPFTAEARDCIAYDPATFGPDCQNLARQLAADCRPQPRVVCSRWLFHAARMIQISRDIAEVQSRAPAQPLIQCALFAFRSAPYAH